MLDQFSMNTSGFNESNFSKIKSLEYFLWTCSSKEVHVNLLQHVDGEGVDLREETHQESDWEAVGEAC